jgi:NAD(P)-dependent dehydrogenase (short-subunit alcohol dehydrogenase family)
MGSDQGGRGRRFDGRAAIVTGAGSGIGRATALRLASEGAAVAAADIDLDAARATEARIRDAGGSAISVPADVSDEAQVARMVRSTVAELGRLDVLHNNAAVLAPDVYGRDLDLSDLAVEVWDRTLAVNARGTMLCCKHAVPSLTRPGGAIVNTISLSALVGDEDHAAYGSSKAAVQALTRYVATMYGKEGIRCNAVAPALVMTDTARAAMPEPVLREKAAERALPWPAEPEDIAAAVAWLASDEARCITGQTLVVDCGTLAHRPQHAIRLWEAAG